MTIIGYPGGKTRALKQIFKYLPDGVTSVVSPFFGGGKAEFAFAKRGIRVRGSDIYDVIVNFWQCVFEDPNLVADYAEKLMPMNRFKYRVCVENFHSIADRFERAGVFYVLNNWSYSGLALVSGGSFLPNRAGFQRSEIESLRDFSVENISISQKDYRDAIESATSDDFLYLDPPYFSNADRGFYGNWGQNHKVFDHRELADLLFSRRNWMLHYDDIYIIRRLYRNYRIEVLEWAYSMGRIRRVRELLIFG